MGMYIWGGEEHFPYEQAILGCWVSYIIQLSSDIMHPEIAAQAYQTFHPYILQIPVLGPGCHLCF